MLKNHLQKFSKNWQQHAATFGQEAWQESTDFLYYIETPIPIDIAKIMVERREDFMQQYGLKAQQIIAPEKLHITLALPGRLGTHFQQNDVSYMKKALQNLAAQQSKIKVELKDFNVFPSVLFTEVLDPSGALQALHENICQQIPFSQHPEYQYENYLPHVSLLYGAQAQNLSQANRLQSSLECELDTLVFGKVKDLPHAKADREVLATYTLQ